MFWDNQPHPPYSIIETENTKHYSRKRHNQNQSSISSDFLQLDGLVDEEDLSTDWELVRMLEPDIAGASFDDAQRRPRVARRMSSCLSSELRETRQRLRARSDLDLRPVLS